MQYRVETTITKLLKWKELSKERQEEEYKKALENESLKDIFSNVLYNEYLDDLDYLQEKYDLNIEPIFSDGSQHYLIGFRGLDRESDKSYISFENEDFYFETDRKNNVKVFNSIYNEDNEEIKHLAKQLEKKIKSFIDSFMNIYNVYQECFMYGYCQAFEDFVKEDLQNNDYEYEEIEESYTKYLTK